MEQNKTLKSNEQLFNRVIHKRRPRGDCIFLLIFGPGMRKNVSQDDSGAMVSTPIAPRVHHTISPVETFLIDENGRLTVSEGFDLARLGLKSPQGGQPVADLFLDAPEMLASFEQALRGRSATTEVTVGGFTFATSFSPIPDEEGKVKRIVGVSVDVTESKKTGEILRKSEFRLRTLFNSAHDAIFMMDHKTFVDCNEATLRVFQCTKEQIIGQTPYRFSPALQSDGRPSEEAALERINAVLNGKSQFFEWKHIRYDGSPFDAEVSLNRVDLDDEVYIQAIVRDVSERKRAEEENKRLAMVANTTTNIVVLADGDGKIEWVNPAFTRVTGYTLEDVIGKKPGSVLRGPETDPEIVNFMREKTNSGLGFKDVEIINYTKDRKPYWVSIEVQPISNAAGKVVQFIGIESDISERKANQKALLDRNEDLQKINTELDRFVYCASHDLRAPISSLLGLIEVARLEKNMDNLPKLLDMQQKSLLRLDRFIKDIVDHSRNTRQTLEAEPTDFQRLVEATLEQLQFMENVARIRKVIHVSQVKPFFTSVTRLDIVLNNLISNAIKYADLRKEDPFLEVTITSDGPTATIRVADNGQGIPDDAQPRVFEMFFRASANGSGSGLGLYIVREAIQKLGGTINLRSTYGRGTEFIVSIPNLIPA
jgi:PAS domain S-box-containing protein